MIKIDVEELIFEVKDEMSCYEEIGEKGAEIWEVGFRKWLNSDKKKKNITKKGDKVLYSLSDESEVFDIADEYLKAIEENKTEDYWKNFQ
ncbi:MAG: hypothetical protein ACI4VF_05780 [Lachnospirales bacterium]